VSKVTFSRKDYIVGKRSIKRKGKVKDHNTRKPWPKGSPLKEARRKSAKAS